MAWATRHRVASHGKIAEDQLLVGRLAVNQGFNPTIVLHPVGQAVADLTNDLVLLKRERRRLATKDQGRQQDERD